MTTNRNIKQELKDFWKTHKGKIKVGATCLLAGVSYGFIKGVLTQSRIDSACMGQLIDRIPHEPDPDDDEPTVE